MKWNHARKGIIEGEIVAVVGDYVDIKLVNTVRVGFADPMKGDGFRSVHAAPGRIIRVRKSLLEPITNQ